MSEDSLRRFIPRANRYVLRPKDQHLLRFSSQSEASTSGVHETTLINLSRTGLAFLVEREFAPPLGDLIKIEFNVPGNEHKVAWWARVVRTEEYTQNIWWMKNDPQFRDLITIGIHFQELPEGHQDQIQGGIDKRLEDLMYEYRKLQLQRLWSWWKWRGIRIAAFMMATAGVLWVLYWLSLPSENYDLRRGAPWGQRFPMFKESGEE